MSGRNKCLVYYTTKNNRERCIYSLFINQNKKPYTNAV